MPLGLVDAKHLTWLEDSACAYTSSEEVGGKGGVRGRGLAQIEGLPPADFSWLCARAWPDFGVQCVVVSLCSTAASVCVW